MEEKVISQLIALNRRFYQTFAGPFSATRGRLQPGVLRALEQVPPDSRVLDLGCGNGELASELGRRGHRGLYVGLDFSPDLLAEARTKPVGDLDATFFQADLAAPSWDSHLPSHAHDVVLAFAVLHHLPSQGLRRQVLDRVHTLLVPDGRFIFSVWQFLNSPRLQSRIQPWEAAGLTPGQVEPGDYLLDWRRGGHGLRYVHHFSLSEVARLARRTDFQRMETFHSDGHGGNLGLYEMWAPDPANVS
jgi:SAM-dependent methyltransferase